MRIAVAVLLSISLLLSSWLWYQLRESNASLNGYVVSTNYRAYAVEQADRALRDEAAT
jgi:hypothetical protein